MENKYGIKLKGVVVACTLLLMGFWMFAVPMLTRRGVKLENDYSDSKAIFILIIVLYSISLVALFVDMSIYAYLWIFLVRVPTIIGACVLLLFEAAHKPYYEDVDKFMSMLNNKDTFSWDELNGQFPKKSALNLFRPNIATCILKDLQSNNLIRYTDSEQIVRITFINPVLGIAVIDKNRICSDC